MKKSLSSRLRTLRGEQSQSEFAAKLATKQTTYSSWERGIKEPSLEIVSEISLQFGVSADYLLGLTDDPTPASQRHAAGAVTVNGHGNAIANGNGNGIHQATLESRVAALESLVAKLAGRQP